MAEPSEDNALATKAWLFWKCTWLLWRLITTTFILLWWLASRWTKFTVVIVALSVVLVWLAGAWIVWQITWLLCWLTWSTVVFLFWRLVWIQQQLTPFVVGRLGG